MDRMENLGKILGGGMCVMIKDKWYSAVSSHCLMELCTQDLEFPIVKCRPFYLPREFTSSLIMTIYIPPQAHTDTALSTLHRDVELLQTSDPDAALVILGDFNKANLKKGMPDFYQHITFITQGERTQDHCYTQHRVYYNAVKNTAFCKSDYNAILLLRKSKQKLQREDLMAQEV